MTESSLTIEDHGAALGPPPASYTPLIWRADLKKAASFWHCGRNTYVPVAQICAADVH